MSNSVNSSSICSIPVTLCQGWSDYELLDSGDGMKLERYGQALLARPEPEAFWGRNLPDSEWEQATAEYSSPTQDENGTWNYAAADGYSNR